MKKLIRIRTSSFSSQQSMVVQVHDCALLDVASEILSEIESEMGLDSLSMPQRKPEEGTGHETPSPREWVTNQDL